MISSAYSGGHCRDSHLRKILNTLECPICLCYKSTFVLNCSHRVCEECVGMIYLAGRKSKKREEDQSQGYRKRNRTNIKCAYCGAEYEWSYSYRKQERICRVDLDAGNVMNVTRKYVERDDLCDEKHAYLPITIVCRTCNNLRCCALCYVEDHKGHNCVKFEDVSFGGPQKLYFQPSYFVFHEAEDFNGIDLRTKRSSNVENVDYVRNYKHRRIISSPCSTSMENLTSKEIEKILNMVVWPRYWNSVQDTNITRGSIITYVDDRGSDGCFAGIGVCSVPYGPTSLLQKNRNFDIDIFTLKPINNSKSQMQQYGEIDTSMNSYSKSIFEVKLDSRRQVKVEDVLMVGLHANFHDDFLVELTPLSMVALNVILLYNYL